MVTKEYLDKKAQGFNTAIDFDSVMAFYDVEEIKKHQSGKRFLEMGSSAGTVTKYLLNVADELDVIEGSLTGIERTKELLGDGQGKLGYIHELWENFEPNELYTDIAFIRGLEHVKEPSQLLGQMEEWISEDGKIHIIVPNANSLHRHIMVKNGKLADLYALRDRDFQVGHVQVYDKENLERDVKNAGLKIAYSGDFFVKPVGTPEMGKVSMDPDNPFVKACYDASEFLPGFGTQLYVVAERK